MPSYDRATRTQQTRRFLFLGLAALVFLVLAAVAGAAGELDPTFDGDGQVTTDFSTTLPSDDEGLAVAIHPDGGIVAAGGSEGRSGVFEWTFARYKPDGGLEPGFDGDGKLILDVGHEALDVAVQPDGKIVAAGDTRVGDELRFAVVRLNPDGSLDPTFDGDGKVTVEFDSFGDIAYALALQADGKIVLAGGSVGNGFGFARLNPDGSLDPTFDGDGRATVAFGEGGAAEAFDVAVRDDGKIVASGAAIDPITAARDFGVVRLNPDGSLDATFGGDGKVVTDFGSDDDEAESLALRPGGKVLAAGWTFGVSGTFDFALARYSADGSLDATFGSGGKVITDFGVGLRNDFAFDVGVEPDGRIVAGGESSSQFALARYWPSGLPDLTFGTDGRVLTDLTHGRALAIQPDGRIVLAGFTDTTARHEDFALARYLPGPLLLLDHFQCYYGTKGFGGRTVSLDDEFGHEDVVLTRFRSFCTPANKNLEGVLAPLGDLSCYTFAGSLGGRTVIIDNQFGRQLLVVGRSRQLCAPTTTAPVGTIPGPTPANLDHFKCYDVQGPGFPPRAVRLFDQFGGADVRVVLPYLLCNPVTKNREQLQHPASHLVCYRIAAGAGFRPRELAARDQFGTGRVRVERPESLCVPSLVTPPTPSD